MYKDLLSNHVTSVFLDVQHGVNIDGEAFVGGSLFVSGTVMGSGPYVDSSDARLKEEVQDLKDALGTVKAIRGVRQHFM